MDESALNRFQNSIRARAGLVIRPQELSLLAKTMEARVQALRLASPEAYLTLLNAGIAEGEAEWTHLFGLLTNQETYFYRDHAQITVLRDYVLPELIGRRRESRTLRIWSAGCSTGEEPYSLSMMLDDLLPFRHGWRITILATDLSEPALERARRGIYGSWSFRARDKIQHRFFVPRGSEWEVKPHLRECIKFAAGNLLDDKFPATTGEMHDMDLIVCRNVFIYFARDAVARVLRKFSATLQPEGYLLTGHTELHDVQLGDLQARSFPQSVVYQRGGPKTAPKPSEPLARPESPAHTARQGHAVSPRPAAPTTGPPSWDAPKAEPPKTPTPKPALGSATVTMVAAAMADGAEQRANLGRALGLIRGGKHGAALELLDTILAAEPANVAAHCLAAQAQANLGRLPEAEAHCARAGEAAPFAPLPFHIRARIAAERGEHAAAKALLKRVLYLDPNSVWSSLELMALYQQEGDTRRAAQLQRAALEIVAGLADDRLVPSEEYSAEAPLTVGELKSHLANNDG